VSRDVAQNQVSASRIIEENRDWVQMTGVASSTRTTTCRRSSICDAESDTGHETALAPTARAAATPSRTTARRTWSRGRWVRDPSRTQRQTELMRSIYGHRCNRQVAFPGWIDLG